MISFASGALISNILIWMAYFVFELTHQINRDLPGSLLTQVYENMPAWRLRELWLPSLLAGKKKNPTCLLARDSISNKMFRYSSLDCNVWNVYIGNISWTGCREQHYPIQDSH
jgi:hypothetical protein